MGVQIRKVKIKRGIFLFLTVIFFTSLLMLNISAIKIGDKLGNVLNSDIKAFINDQRIPSYNIANKTVIIAEDLANYGFDVVWSQVNRTISITLNPTKKSSPLEAEDNTKQPGTAAFPYVHTDIIAYVNGKKVESFNINGRLVIYFSSLEDYGTFKWDQTNKHSKFYTTNTSVNPDNPQIGDKIGNVLNSDIKAFINDQRIPSYNIANQTVIIAEDLANYGFDVVWNQTTRTISITLNSAKKTSPLEAEDNTKQPGTVAFPYVYTDIVAYVNGKKVESFNINGRLVIYFSSLEDYGTFKWNQTSKHSSLYTTFSISGKIMGSDTSEGLSNATVNLKDNITGNLIATTKTQSDGMYTFTGLSAGNYIIESSMTEYDTFTLNCSITGSSITGINLTLQKAYSSISGVILDSDSYSGLVGATVKLKNDKGIVISTAISQTSGAYSFKNISDGRYTIEVSMAGYSSSATSSFELSGAVSGKNISIKKIMYTISGKITGNAASTTGLSGVTVTLRAKTASTTNTNVISMAKTESNGVFSLTNVPSGTYIFEASMSGYETFTSDFTVNKDITNYNFSLSRANFSISGIILDSDSYSGLSGVTVQLKNSSGVVISTVNSQTNGVYTFSNISSGKYIVEASMTGYSSSATSSFELLGSVTGQNLIINRTSYSYIITGKITGSDTFSVGLPNVTVKLKSASNQDVIKTTITQSDGTYIFTDVLYGSYVIELSTNNYNTKLSDISVLGNVASNDIVMQRNGYTVRGTVRNSATSIGLKDVTVQIKNTATQSTSTQVTLSDGSYVFTELPSGNYSITVVGYNSHISSFTIYSTDLINFDLIVIP